MFITQKKLNDIIIKENNAVIRQCRKAYKNQIEYMIKYRDVLETLKNNDNKYKEEYDKVQGELMYLLILASI